MRMMSMAGWAAVAGLGMALAACGSAPASTGGGLAQPSAALDGGAPPHLQLIEFGSPVPGRPQEVIGDEHAARVLDGAG